MRRALLLLAVLGTGCAGSDDPAPSPEGRRTPSPQPALGEPFDILEEAPGSYLIADRTMNAVFRLRNGALETVAELDGPRDLEPKPDGRVLVASGRNVVALDPRTGATETVTTARADVLGIAARGAYTDGRRVVRDGRVLVRGLDGAHGLLDTEAGLVVCDSGNGRVLLVGRDRRILADGLDLPSFAAQGPEGALYVTEFGAGRLVRIERAGKVTPIADVPAPTALSVARDGSILVTGLGGSVSRVAPQTGEVETLA